MKTNILAIFTCYNRKEKTEKCLESLMRENLDIEFSFIATDDGSTDGTSDVLKQYANIQIVHGNGNCYYSGGMRLGIQCAKTCCDGYDWILLFNDDVVFFPHAIEKLKAFAKGRHKIIVGATCDEYGKLSYGGVLKTSGSKPSFQIVMSGEKRITCDTFNANCVLLPTEIFKALPNVDRHYTHSMGDFDYGLEASKRGIPITVSDFFVGKCVDNPLKGTWRDISLPRKERLKRKETPKGLPYREWFYFIHKHYGLFSACIHSMVPYIKILIRKP